MTTQLISYDLNSPGQKYTNLIEDIKAASNGAWWHNLDSTWLIKTSLSSSDLRDRLVKHIDSGDELLVVDVTGDARAWHGFKGSASTWLKETWD